MRPCLRAFLFAALFASAAVAAPTISFHQVPTALPNDTTFGPYSPLLAIDYAGLNAEIYKIRVHLLNGVNHQCASFNDTMWCNAELTIDNSAGTNASGRMWDARGTDVFDAPSFLWVVDLHEQDGDKVANDAESATSHTNRAPVLGAIGNKSVAAGGSLDFTVAAPDAESDAVTYSAHNLPPGATFDTTTGAFHWEPSGTGTFANVAFVATQAGVPLSDAEIITITATNTLDVLAWSGDATTGESGPAVLTVTRSGTLASTATVNFATSNDTATAGSDYTATSGTLTFTAGQSVQTVRVPITNDPSVESNETFTVTLSAPSNATIGGSAEATATIVDDDTPALAGQWSSLLTWPTVPIHMHLLPTGSVLFWDRHEMGESWDGTPQLWNPANPNVVTPVVQPEGWDLFCSGHTLLADGRLFIAGGHIDIAVGEPKAGVYDPFTNDWTIAANMNEGRWYPTNTTLANGDVLVMAGTRAHHGDTNPLPQIWQAESATWRNLTSALFAPPPAWPDFYPFVYLAPNGKIFMAGPQQTARSLNTAGTGAWTDVAASSLSYRDYGTSVLYDDGKVLIAGGNPREPDEFSATILPSATAEVIDLGVATPSWHAVAPMTVGRRHHNSTILPDGTILVTGGSSLPGFDQPLGAVLYAELWDPSTETWTPLASHTRYRGYHSNALLLPDARVLVAGGGHPGATAENNAEIYSPPYLFNGSRPTITSAPSSVIYNQQFFVQTPDAASVSSVTWLRLGSVTHAFNQNQRINRLAFTETTGGLHVTAPADSNLCPPGHYMLFLLNDDGVPSVAAIVQIMATSLRLTTVAPPAGRTSGGQTITMTGAFAGLSTVTMGGAPATWSFSSGDTEISVTTPAHATGAVSVTLTPASGAGLTKPNVFAFLPTVFTDDTLTANATKVKGEHVEELRDAVDALRLVAGLASVTWTDATLADLKIKAVHITELRAALDEAAVKLGFGSTPYTDPLLAIDDLVKRIHVEELRQRIRDIAE